MKRVYFFGIVLTLLLASCGGEPEVANEISEEDFFGETGEELIQEDTTTEIAIPEPEGQIGQFVYNQLETFDTSGHSEFHALDRFTFNQREKVSFRSKETVPYGTETMVTPVAELFYYSFADTAKTKNAFYNWLDCFTDECEQIKLNEDFEYLKTPPQFTIVYDTVIVVVDYRCEDANFDWKPFQDSLIAKFGRDYNYQLEVGCGGPLSWK